MSENTVYRKITEVRTGAMTEGTTLLGVDETGVKKIPAGEIVEVDATLTKKGVAADAAATGEKLDKLSEGKAYQQYVTDGEGKAKWEDRLAYNDTVETVILPKTTGVITNDGEYAFCHIEVGSAPSENIKSGDTILVAWTDGKTYECTVYDGDLFMFGSESDGCDDGTYPFSILQSHSDPNNSIIVNMNPRTTPDGTEITFSLTKKETIVKPIPAEYLPYKHIVFDLGNLTCNADFDTVVQAVQNGGDFTAIISEANADLCAKIIVATYSDSDNSCTFSFLNEAGDMTNFMYTKSDGVMLPG